MAILKCKMCGGDLSVTEGMKIVECDFCGTTQTVPNADDEKKTNLFNRANRLRIASEFDRAAGIYESIIAEFPNEAEAYWGLCLCKYGIEYVDDPKTAEKIPTCHRTSFESIFNDSNYNQAISYSDPVAKGVYESEAKAIDVLQKDILSIVHKEKPFDVFICYKETDETGRRTQDSVIANDIYYQLTQEGFKVFYAAITLEDKLGSAYEPCIFAALNSAKVMLSIGTKPEYFNAVWVKNEWSRFLKIMKKDRSKVLIPCYKDMDAYELPEEFAHLQAQDMSKIGFINDVVRGIKKVLSASKPKETKKETVVVNTNSATTAPLLQRVFMFLEDGNWNSADEYCEKVLDLEPQNALAYVGKLMVELRVKTQQSLSDCEEPFDNHNYYQKAMRFADDTLKASLTDAITVIKTRILERKYVAALRMKEKAKTDSDYTNAVKAFKELGDYKDSSSLANECQNTANELFAEGKYKTAVSMLENAISEQELLDGINILDTLGDYRDSIELKTKYEESWRSRKELAMGIWAEYCSVNDKILAITAEIEKKTAPTEKLKKDIENAKGQLREIKSKSDQIVSLEAQLKTTQQQLAQANSELSSLGMFAFSKKKEVAARVKELSSLSAGISDKISQAKKFIKGAGSVDALQASIESSERKIAECLSSKKSLNDELASLQAQLVPVVQKLENRQTIATLAQDEEILPLLVDEHSVAMIIKADDELRYMIKNSELFYLLPKTKQKSLFGNSSFDAEAVYYQACQAMEEAKSMDDIKWARGEFAAIRRYKDSNQRLAKCDEMIANNTYKL